MKRLLPFLCLLLLISKAFPWGAQGHQAVGEVARQLLTPAAKAAIEKILGNDDLGSCGTWLDEVRAVARNHTNHLTADEKTEARAFNKAQPKNAEWHYVNLPVGYTIYAPDGAFSSPDDVVHAIGTAVDVLEGKSNRYTKIQALRVLVHLVGDVHQPLHTISGYFDCKDPTQPKLISNPALALNFPHDRGGNQLFYTKTLELHALWDTKLPNRNRHSSRSSSRLFEAFYKEDKFAANAKSARRVALNTASQGHNNTGREATMVKRLPPPRS